MRCGKLAKNAGTAFLLSALAALGLVVGFVGGKSLTHPPAAAAHSFDWIGTPYLGDYFGQYAYRDLYFTWGNWSGGYVWTYSATSYVAIASPGTGWHFSQFSARKTAQILPTKWIVSGVDTPGFYVSYSSSPQFPTANLTSDGGGSFWVGFAMCKNYNDCIPNSSGWVSQQLEAQVPLNGTSGSRRYSQFPQQWY